MLNRLTRLVAGLVIAGTLTTLVWAQAAPAWKDQGESDIGLAAGNDGDRPWIFGQISFAFDIEEPERAEFFFEGRPEQDGFGKGAEFHRSFIFWRTEIPIPVSAHAARD